MSNRADGGDTLTETDLIRVLSAAYQRGTDRIVSEITRNVMSQRPVYQPHDLACEDVAAYVPELRLTCVGALPPPRDYAEHERRVCVQQGYGMRTIHKDPLLG
jgi:hypothetical protein